MSILDEAAEQVHVLSLANRAAALLYPGEPGSRQPVHTVYGGAHLYKADTTRRLGVAALRSMDAWARDAVEFARAVGFVPEADLRAKNARELQAAFDRNPAALRDDDPSGWLATAVYSRVRAKLQREPVEDFRIDFEDGFGARPFEEEDEFARGAAKELARATAEQTAPPFVGIRIKSLNEEWTERAARTLEIFVDTLVAETRGRLPPLFVVTLPKVTVAEQPRTLALLLELLEKRHGLEASRLKMEIMIEATQALLGRDGRSPLRDFLEACGGRCVGAHLGTYDFTASCNITAAYQSMDHPMCDLARGMMVLAYAGTGVFLSDGATNVMPVGPHKGDSLTADEVEENRASVHRAWRLSHAHIRRSLQGGLYQGWDLHPAQLPVRYATYYSFFLEGFVAAAERLRNFVEKAAQATLVGDVFDDAATGQGLLNYFLRALYGGAIGLDEIEVTGLTRDEIALRSFAKILQSRRTRVRPSAPSRS
jgi:citrate lyase beta subunit